jgi:hypothetical protein
VFAPTEEASTFLLGITERPPNNFDRWPRTTNHLIFWFSPITPAGVPVMAAVTAATI